MMPSQMIDNQGIASSPYLHRLGERPVGFSKMDSLRNPYGTKFDGTTGLPCRISAALPSFEKLTQADFWATNRPEIPEQVVGFGMQRHVVGAERALSPSLNSWSSFDLGAGTRSNSEVQLSWDKKNTMSSHYDNGLFSDFLGRNLYSPSNSAFCGHFADTNASNCEEEEEPFESLEEIEAQTIGNLLPHDDDVIFGAVDRLEDTTQQSGEYETDLELFSSVGGMDLGDDITSRRSGGVLGGANVSVARKHHYGEAKVSGSFMETRGIHNSSSAPDGLPCVLRTESGGNQPGLSELGCSVSQLENDFQGPSIPCSLPVSNDRIANGVPSSVGSMPWERVDYAHFGIIRSSNGFGTSANGKGNFPAELYMRSNSNHPQPPTSIWLDTPSFSNGYSYLHGLPRSPSHMLNSTSPMNGHHVGSAPAPGVNPSFRDRENSYAGRSHETFGFHQGSLENMRISGSHLRHMDFVSPNIFPHVGGKCIDMSITTRNLGLHSRQRSNMMHPSRGHMNMVNSFGPPGERVRSRRNETNSGQADNKKQYELDIDRIRRGEETRTTLMIKNIPNKYTSKMLMAAIDEYHRGTYDFIYLPIDFKNKCNVGYALIINMVDPSRIIPFYETFNGKKWEKFNSEKVASLAYARIQGKGALVAHFQNSSLMTEDKRCRPIVFHSDGPNAGDQVPFPMGINVRPRRGRSGSASSTEDNHKESPPKGSSDGDSTSWSGKESD